MGSHRPQAPPCVLYHYGNTSLAVCLRFYAEPALNRHFHNNPEIICTASRLNLGSVEDTLAGATAYPKLFWREGGGGKAFPYLLCICHLQTPVPQ